MAGKSGPRLSAIWPWIMDDHGMKSGSDHLWLLEEKKLNMNDLIFRCLVVELC